MANAFTLHRNRIGRPRRSTSWTADKRYQSRAWRKLAASVRTGKACWRCGHPATVADRGIKSATDAMHY